MNGIRLFTVILFLMLPAAGAVAGDAHSSHDQGTDGSAQPAHEMDMSSDAMQGGSVPPDARDPNAYADGLKMGPMPGMDMADDALYGRILTEKFELFDGNEGDGFQFDGQAWFGGDRHRLWLKADGGRSGGKAESTRFEMLWSRIFAPYWSTQLGVRHDEFEGPGRDWVAFGVQGLAPYWFEVEATAYVSENGRTAARAEVSYDLLLTQKLILQPNAEVNIYGKDDSARDIGSGLSDLELGLRLRYEFKREFAPYIGVEWNRTYGDTADFARDDGEDVDDLQLVIGLRLWY